MFKDFGWLGFDPFLNDLHAYPPPYIDPLGDAGPFAEDRWVVVLEFAVAPGDDYLRLDDVLSLVEKLGQWDTSGLYSPQRYSLQLHIPAADPSTAVGHALDAHRAASRSLGEPGWSARLVRTEVLLVAEMEQGWDSGRTAAAEDDPLSSAVIPREVYRTTRAMLSAATPAEIMAELVRFTTAVGGTVRVGSPAPVAGEIEVDIGVAGGVAGGVAMTATAEAFSVAGMIFEQYLPALVSDAQTASHRLTSRA